ncbi:RNA polymerase sigma factor FliA [wastewater metagenome]|uniref:RNA polymerase sigma factor FliA n=2 Tax=unclassified sequences TaxID=12908 RepID=A0A5B8RAQ4_9ZZZZ|nr:MULTISPECIES: RNA polymerase sigma factor FliA [Arhodomonas]MCS4502780.1 RNA polymerase sigma factor FliA [Arhodomonas aquaeolei]QEA03737.1 RNA polymerase sigma factor FliA [uncultured organism]
MNGHALYEAVQRGSSDDLLVANAPLVRRIAHHLASRLPPSVQIEDLIQAGMVGLLEAARQFDASQGASFQTYAGIRIRGAMLDEIRRLDWTPRSVHRRSREAAEAIHVLENELGREPRDAEVAARLGVSVDDYHGMLADASSAHLFSMDQTDPQTGETHDPAGDGPSPQDVLTDGHFRADLAEAIRGLSERDQLVMQLYYDEELNLREIGEVLGVSESRVSQIRGKIMLKLKASLADWLDG